MNDTAPSLAERLYPSMAQSTQTLTVSSASNAQGSTATTTALEEGAAPANAQTVSQPPAAPTTAELDAAVDELVGRELTPAERLYPEGTGPTFDTLQAADGALDVRFAALQHDADEEDAIALTDGRRAAAELMVELQVPKAAANEIAAALDEAQYRWMAGSLPDDETFNRQRDTCERTLRAEWGKDYGPRLALAQRTYRQALAKAPWLENLVEEVGPGNNAALVKHFASIGLANARRARRASK